MPNWCGTEVPHQFGMVGEAAAYLLRHRDAC